MATPSRAGPAYLLMLASGFAGLGYQVVWTQQSALWLGHEAAAVLAVVAAFFGGLAAGALLLGPAIERSARPLRWYVACEAAIAGWSLLLLFAMAPASEALLRLTGAAATPAWQWTVAFVGSFALLLPATAAMGATLPALERALTPLRARGRSIAALYAANTLGAVLGVLGTTFWLVPSLGLTRTAAVCVLLNLLCVGAALALPWRTPLPGPTTPAPSPASGKTLARLAVTGLLGIGYEVLVVRVLSQVSEDTVYTFAMLLAVYLVGSALGAAAYQRAFGGAAVGASEDASARLRHRLLCAVALACGIGGASLWGADAVQAWLMAALSPTGGGGAMGLKVGAEAALAALAFGLPTLAMGALFSHLSREAAVQGLGFGRALGANTAGAALAPLLFGVLLTPWLGPKAALLLIVAGYLALQSRAAWHRPGVWLPAAAALTLAVAAPPLAFVDIPPGTRLLSYAEGTLAAVSVVEDEQGIRRLRIDNRQQEGSSGNLLVDGRQALLPLLLHPAPERALFLGLGTGITAATAAADHGLQVDAVELLPEVIAASALFTPALGDGRPNPRLHLLAADARRYVRSTRLRYDLVVSDNFHPARSGSGSLYTVEHFQAVRQRLNEHGVFCQWLPLHQLDLGTLRSIVRSFVEVYPHATALLASNSLATPVLGLVGRADNASFNRPALHQRLAGIDLSPAPTPAAYGIEDDFALLGSFVAGPHALARFAGDAPANTDDRPVVAYTAPRITYAPDSRPGDRLIALLQQLSVTPGDLVDATADPAWSGRLAAYFEARNQFILAGRSVQPSADPRTMLVQVREPLLASLRTSPDFRPAYTPLWRLAQALAPSDPDSARDLLGDLVRLQPARPEAGESLQALGTARR